MVCFPVTFRALPNDPFGIAADDLRDSDMLRRAHPASISMFLDKMAAESPAIKCVDLLLPHFCHKAEIFQPTDSVTEGIALVIFKSAVAQLMHAQVHLLAFFANSKEAPGRPPVWLLLSDIIAASPKINANQPMEESDNELSTVHHTKADSPRARSGLATPPNNSCGIGSSTNETSVNYKAPLRRGDNVVRELLITISSTSPTNAALSTLCGPTALFKACACDGSQVDENQADVWGYADTFDVFRFCIVRVVRLTAASVLLLTFLSSKIRLMRTASSTAFADEVTGSGTSRPSPLCVSLTFLSPPLAKSVAGPPLANPVPAPYANARERAGNTAIGHGAALEHACYVSPAAQHETCLPSRQLETRQ
ncbi:hypothetical protein R3P38DRAFT_3532917 [Favolaschia claudopus]|uniref:Uncharacterized protein n=1 Tax=Favolaschia claudopus TaxID=2862362 RepID=A0AAW0BF58_9AGAR